MDEDDEERVEGQQIVEFESEKFASSTEIPQAKLHANITHYYVELTYSTKQHLVPCKLVLYSHLNKFLHDCAEGKIKMVGGTSSSWLFG